MFLKRLSFSKIIYKKKSSVSLTDDTSKFIDGTIIFK